MNINSLKIKLLLITIVPFTIGIFVLSGINFEKTQNTLNNTLKKFETTITKEKESLIQHQFEVAQTLIKTVIEKEQNIELAKQKVIELLAGVRYLDDKSGYFFAYEQRGDDYYFAFHPANPKLNNTKTNIKSPDAKGYAFREDLIKFSKEQKYITYHYENLSTKEVVLKMASSIFIPEFNWVLVTGIYADDIEKDINELQEEMNRDINILFWIAICVTVLLNIVLISIIVPSINKIILKPLNIFQTTLESFFKYLNNESNKVDRIKNYSKDEIGHMSKILDQNIEIARKEIDDNNLFIETTIDILEKFQKGDLSQRLNIEVDDINLSKLKSVMNQMAQELEKNIVNVLKVIDEYSKYDYVNRVDTTKMLIENKKNGETLSESSNILLSNVEKLNESSTSRAANLEETAASLEEMTSNLRSSTQNDEKMASIASSVTSRAKNGEKLVNQTFSSMEEINIKISSINDAISVIDQIALQTNIMILNAAVEAATAREA